MNTPANTPVRDALPQSLTFRLEFPPEVTAERDAVFEGILRLMTENTLSAVQEACRLQIAWLDRYPDDYVMLDFGESLWMLADAIDATTTPESEAAVILSC